MLKNKIFILLFTCFMASNIIAQTCTDLGQNPGTSFPVCGTATFTQTSVKVCGGRAIPGPCTADAVTDINPYWYRFTCFSAGTLAFVLAPNNPGDDYDWQLFDITGKTPTDVYTDASLFVACNWSGLTGNTGTDATATSLTNCGGVGYPTFSKEPTLILNHQYILLVSHFAGDAQSGYTLTFSGGTANITDPVQPHLLSVKAACNGAKMAVKLNKKMKCSSVPADGSAFTILPGNIPITAATGQGCSTSFDTDSVTLTLAGPLPPGNYQITVRPTNNLLDNCNNFIPSTDTLNVTVYPVVATPMDSLTAVACAPSVLQLVFRDPILCSSVAADGSDFFVSGTSSVTITGAVGICSTDNLTNSIQVTLSAPIDVAGQFKISLQTGTDGNTIINQCGKPTPAGSFLNFSTKDTVSALFSYTLKYGCVADTIAYTHDGKNGVNSWQWNFDNIISSTNQNTTIYYPVFGQKTATLLVSNGTCSDSSKVTILLDNAIKAIFEGTSVVCPGDPATFTDQSTGTLNNLWQWNFGNGNTSNLQTPPQQFYLSANDTRDVPVQLIVTNSIGCSDTATNTIKVVGNCYIAIPKAFSPNGDGLNDYLFPTNAYKAKNLSFSVYNRNGQKIFTTQDWTNKWDGTYKGSPQDTGTYVWILTYTNIDTNKRIELKGSTVLIR